MCFLALSVQVFERDLTAIRGEGQYRGPIQIQSNALAALEALDERVAEEVMAEGCVTGDRVNGLCDGLTGEWCVRDVYKTGEKRGPACESVRYSHVFAHLLWSNDASCASSVP